MKKFGNGKTSKLKIRKGDEKGKKK